MSGRNWYEENETTLDVHPVLLEAERRLNESEDYRRLWERIITLSARLGDVLEGEAMETWLDLESAFHERASLLAAVHYNLGVDAGLDRRIIDDVLEDASGDASGDARISHTAAVRALTLALARIVERL